MVTGLSIEAALRLLEEAVEGAPGPRSFHGDVHGHHVSIWVHPRVRTWCEVQRGRQSLMYTYHRGEWTPPTPCDVWTVDDLRDGPLALCTPPAGVEVAVIRVAEQHLARRHGMELRLRCGCAINVYGDNRVSPEFGYTYCHLHAAAENMRGLLASLLKAARGKKKADISKVLAQAAGEEDEDGLPIDATERVPVEQRLATAVLKGDDDALFPLIDCLVEQGKVDKSLNAEVAKLRELLTNILEVAPDWGFAVAETRIAEEHLGLEPPRPAR
jgi:hypothetical protein